jgi:hypothetical protein
LLAFLHLFSIGLLLLIGLSFFSDGILSQ